MYFAGTRVTRLSGTTTGLQINSVGCSCFGKCGGEVTYFAARCSEQEQHLVFMAMTVYAIIRFLPYLLQQTKDYGAQTIRSFCCKPWLRPKLISLRASPPELLMI